MGKRYFPDSFSFKGHFKGFELFKIARNDKDDHPFMFGLAKARLIVDNYDEIKKYVEESDQ